MDSLRDILTRASKVAGTDLCKVLDERKAETEQIRSSLPRKARKIFDRELYKQTESPADRKRREAIANDKKNKSRLHKLEKSLERVGIENPCPREIPFHLIKQTKHVIADSSGWAARFYSRICWHKVGVGLAHRAALSYDNDGIARYSYVGQSREAIRARCVLALGLLLLCLSRPTGRRKQGWSRIIKKIPLDAFIAILADPYTGEKMHRNTVGGNYHRESSDKETSGSVGYLRALHNVGLVYTRQAKWRPGDNPANQKGWEDIEPEEMAGALHPSGWYTSLQRYWIVADRFMDPVDAAKRAELMVAWLSGNIPWQRDEDGRFVPCTDSELHVSRREKPPD